MRQWVRDSYAEQYARSPVSLRHYPRQHAIDHHSREAEIVGRIAQFCQSRAVHVLRDLRVLAQQVEQRPVPGQCHAADVVDQVVGMLAAQVGCQTHHHGLRDDEAIRHVEVGAHAFDVDFEEDPLQALATLLDDPPHYDVVLSDVQMPAVSGPEILSVLRRAHSPVAGRFVFMTAANVSDFPGGAQTFGRPILRKPVSMMELVRVLRTVARGEVALEAQSAITS